ncbi:YchJ family protein [Kingella negevensis]|uniref:YchJ family protein n=1 Tax=Kingella negevensis TaxID=1522312 RepID=UPI00254AE6D4|nr:YchJ family protein [Kingella negevensis]MDK4697146.1 YchJ family protein [Kingella negevensis]
MLCPCQSSLSSLSYFECCEPFHLRQSQPETAEQLMRSRYSAYVLQQIDYLVATTVPAQQNLLNQADMLAWSQQAQWLGLTVHQHIPKIGKRHAQVEFTARFAENGQAHEHRELSAFVQIDGAWFFIDATVPLPSMKSLCFCGSEKKFKACCGQFFK